MTQLNEYIETTSNQTLKSAIEKLTTHEKIQITRLVNTLVETNKDEAVNALREQVGKRDEALYELKVCRASLGIAEEKYYYVKGFYDAVNNQETIEWGGKDSKTMLTSNTFEIKNDYLRGLKEGIEYLTKRPDQIIQHYQDPDPKAKVYQHRKDRD